MQGMEWAETVSQGGREANKVGEAQSCYQDIGIKKCITLQLHYITLHCQKH